MNENQQIAQRIYQVHTDQFDTFISQSKLESAQIVLNHASHYLECVRSVAKTFPELYEQVRDMEADILSKEDKLNRLIETGVSTR